MHAFWGWVYAQVVSQNWEYGCTVLYNGVLSMRTRLLEPCAAQICCGDGILKNVLWMSECLGESSDCI